MNVVSHASAALLSMLIISSVAQAQDMLEDDREDNGLSELEMLSRSKDDPFQQFGEEVEREPVSVTLRALDKITARFTDIEIDINAKAEFGSLEILPRYCDKRPPEDFPETTAFLEVFDKGNSPERAHVDAVNPSAEALDEAEASSESRDVANEQIPDIAVEGEPIFRGWMFASSPALNPLEHPVYDVWVIDCKTVVVDS